MKKIITLGILLVAGFGASAQFNKGRMLVGGTVGFSATTDKTKVGSTTTTNDHRTYLSITPQFGYFVINRLAVGAGVTLSFDKHKADGNSSYENYTTVAFAPFVRYYLQPGIFFQGQVGIGSSKNKYYDDSSHSSTTNTSTTTLWSLGVGYAWFLSDHVAVEPILQYGATYRKYDNNNKF